MRVCIVGASGKLGQYMVQHALDRGYEVVGVCRAESVEKLNAFKGRITVIPGATNDAEVIKRALAGCDGVLVVLVPRGVHGYSTGTAQAVLDHAPPGARLVFSSGWHITRDGQDVYSWKLKAIVKVFGPLARLARFADLDDQVEACRRVFASDTRWTVVRGSDLEEGESQGLPVWSRHVGDPILESNITRRVDFALFMVEALENEELVHEAPAIVGRQTPSALALDFAVLRRGVRDQRVEQPLRRGCDLLDCAREGFLVRLRRLREAADLAHVLERGRLDLVPRRRRLEVVERVDVSAHGRLLRRAGGLISVAAVGLEPTTRGL